MHEVFLEIAAKSKECKKTLYLLFVFFPPYSVIIFRIQFFSAFRAYRMCEQGLGMLADITFYLGPIPFIISYFFCRRSI